MNNEEHLVEVEVPSKEELYNRIIAVGVNSLANSYFPDDQKLMRDFSTQGFDIIMDSWGYLSEKVQFFIFKTHIDSFKEFMLSRHEVNND